MSGSIHEDSPAPEASSLFSIRPSSSSSNHVHEPILDSFNMEESLLIDKEPESPQPIEPMESILSKLVSNIQRPVDTVEKQRSRPSTSIVS